LKHSGVLEIKQVFWLKFTPLEFETEAQREVLQKPRELKFTPLEFETETG